MFSSTLKDNIFAVARAFICDNLQSFNVFKLLTNISCVSTTLVYQKQFSFLLYASANTLSLFCHLEIHLRLPF